MQNEGVFYVIEMKVSPGSVASDPFLQRHNLRKRQPRCRNPGTHVALNAASS